jgi:hypothetical protein
MRVIVYKNLIRGDWSVAEVKGTRTRGKVIDHVAQIALRDVEFVVSEASRQRVLRDKCRSVHAWALGEIAEAAHGERAQISYNPYRGPDFTVNGAPIAAAPLVEFASDGRAYSISTEGNS